MRVFKKNLGVLTIYIYNLRKGHRCIGINYFKGVRTLEISLYFWNIDLLLGRED